MKPLWLFAGVLAAVSGLSSRSYAQEAGDRDAREESPINTAAPTEQERVSIHEQPWEPRDMLDKTRKPRLPEVAPKPVVEEAPAPIAAPTPAPPFPTPPPLLHTPEPVAPPTHHGESLFPRETPRLDLHTPEDESSLYDGLTSLAERLSARELDPGVFSLDFNFGVGVASKGDLDTSLFSAGDVVFDHIWAQGAPALSLDLVFFPSRYWGLGLRATRMKFKANPAAEIASNIQTSFPLYTIVSASPGDLTMQSLYLENRIQFPISFRSPTDDDSDLRWPGMIYSLSPLLGVTTVDSPGLKTTATTKSQAFSYSQLLTVGSPKTKSPFTWGLMTAIDFRILPHFGVNVRGGIMVPVFPNSSGLDNWNVTFVELGFNVFF